MPERNVYTERMASVSRAAHLDQNLGAIWLTVLSRNNQGFYFTRSWFLHNCIQDVCGLQEEPRRDMTAFTGPTKP